MVAPTTLPDRSYVPVHSVRDARLAFNFRARDLALKAVTDHNIALTRATAGGAVAGRNGVLRVPVHSQPRYEMLDLDGDGVRETPALIVDPPRSNLATHGRVFENAAWSKSRATAADNTEIAPDGSLTGCRLFDTTNNQTHRVIDSFTITDGANVGLVLFAKIGTLSQFSLRLHDATEANSVGRHFNLLTASTFATETGGTASLVASGIDGPYAEGYYRCWMIGNLGAGITSARMQIRLGTGVYVGTGTDYLIIWGAEENDNATYPTTPILTAGTALTRNADALSTTISLGEVLSHFNDDITVYTKVCRPTHADVSGALGVNPGIVSLGSAAPRLGLYFTDASRVITAAIDTASTDASATAAIPTGTAIEVCAQFSDLTEGGKVRLDVGSGFGALSSAASAFSALGDSTLLLGKYDDHLGGGLLELKIARGLLTLAQMQEAF